jgi:hypothetical protein
MTRAAGWSSIRRIKRLRCGTQPNRKRGSTEVRRLSEATLTACSSRPKQPTKNWPIRMGSRVDDVNTSRVFPVLSRSFASSGAVENLAFPQLTAVYVSGWIPGSSTKHSSVAY